MARKERDEALKNLPGCAGEYIELIARKMGYRRRVRLEVMRELAGHFTDALKECASEEEREQKARELIEEFGDAKLLGVLCRRAKKRCRSLWRTIIVRSFQTVGVLFVCLVIYVMWFISGTPAITTNYIEEFNETVRPAADESLNAAPFYAEAVERLAGLRDDVPEAIGKIGKDPNERDEKIAREWLVENSKSLALVHEGSQRAYFWMTYANPNDSTDTMGILIPNLADYRTLGKALCWRARLAAKDGQYNTAFVDLVTSYGLGRHLKGNKTVIEQLVGMAIESLSVNVLRDILAQYCGDIGAETLARLQEELQEMIDEERFIVSLAVERLCMYDQIQRCFTEDGVGRGHLCVKALLKALPLATGKSEDSFVGEMLPRMPHILFTHPNKAETRRSVDEFYNYMKDYAGKTPAELREEQVVFEKAFEEFAEGNILLEMLLPAFSRVVELSHRNRSDVEASLAVIAIIRYEKETGRLPNSLEELVEQGFLERVPMDPYSDGPLVHRKVGDDFTLYSAGLNFDDDGGMAGRDRDSRPKLWGSSGDAVFWPVMGD